jgi:hypothetical protein
LRGELGVCFISWVGCVGAPLYHMYSVDVKSAPHAKHTASRKAGLTHVAESEACQLSFPETDKGWK